MFCKNCGAEMDLMDSMCPSCGYDNGGEKENKKHGILPISKREKVDIMGVSLPIVFISIFVIILGYGGYITPLLLLAGVILLCKVENKALTNNFLIVFGLYAAQFVLDTCITFVASIPARFFSWLAGLFESVETIEAISKIANIFNGGFNIINGLVAMCFFALYVLCIISLFKSDKIKIPFIGKLFKKFIE